MQAKWYYYILLGLVDVEANYLGKNTVLFLVYAMDFICLKKLVNTSIILRNEIKHLNTCGINGPKLIAEMH